jgi:hypothetical protein
MELLGYKITYWTVKKQGRTPILFKSDQVHYHFLALQDFLVPCCASTQVANPRNGGASLLTAQVFVF